MPRARREKAYKRVHRLIKEWIQQGKLRPGEKLPPDWQLEKEFNTCRHTISKGLAPLVNDGILRRRQGQGTFVVDPAAAKLTAYRLIKFLGPVMPSTEGSTLTPRSPFASRLGLLDGVHEVLGQNLCDLSIDLPRTQKEQFDYLRRYGEEEPTARYAGLLLWSEPSPGFNDALRRLTKSRCPMVLLDSYLRELPLDFVVSDNLEGGRLMAEHIAGLGHRRLAYITHSVANRSSIQERLAGVLLGAVQNGLSLADCTVAQLEEPSMDVVAETRRVVEVLLGASRSPTALLFSNDDLALAALEYIREKKVDVPQDISVAGYDGIVAAEHAALPLTTIVQDFFSMGLTAASILMERLAGKSPPRPYQVFIPPKLVVRMSTGRSPAINGPKGAMKEA